MISGFAIARRCVKIDDAYDARTGKACHDLWAKVGHQFGGGCRAAILLNSSGSLSKKCQSASSSGSWPIEPTVSGDLPADMAEASAAKWIDSGSGAPASHAQGSRLGVLR